MRALLQRVRMAEVRVAGEICGAIGPGLLIFLCAMPGDEAETAALLAAKILKLRLFRDGAGKMNLSLPDAGGQILVVSQFTLGADLWQGNRPGFSRSSPPELADPLYRAFIAALTAAGQRPEEGRFGAEMAVSLCNDGPVTLYLDTERRD